MERAEKIAFDAAKEITIAALKNDNLFQSDNDTLAAKFFETVYSKIIVLAKQIQN